MRKNRRRREGGTICPNKLDEVFDWSDFIGTYCRASRRRARPTPLGPRLLLTALTAVAAQSCLSRLDKSSYETIVSSVSIGETRASHSFNWTFSNRPVVVVHWNSNADEISKKGWNLFVRCVFLDKRSRYWSRVPTWSLWRMYDARPVQGFQISLSPSISNKRETRVKRVARASSTPMNM